MDFSYDSGGKFLTHVRPVKKVIKTEIRLFHVASIARILSAKKISHIGCSGGRCRGHNNPSRLSRPSFSRVAAAMVLFRAGEAHHRLYEHSEDLALGISIGSESSPSSAFLYDNASIFVPAARDRLQEATAAVFSVTIGVFSGKGATKNLSRNYLHSEKNSVIK